MMCNRYGGMKSRTYLDFYKYKPFQLYRVVKLAKTDPFDQSRTGKSSGSYDM